MSFAVIRPDPRSRRAPTPPGWTRHWMPSPATASSTRQPAHDRGGRRCLLTPTPKAQDFDGLRACGARPAMAARDRRGHRQAAQLDYAPAFQFGHPLSFELANRVKELTPAGLDWCSSPARLESADTSLKMARAYWRQGPGHQDAPDRPRKGLPRRELGGISVGGIVANRKLFGQGVEADHLPHTQPPAGSFQKGSRRRARSWPTACWT